MKDRRVDTPVTEIKGLTKRFGKLTALDMLSFSVCKGNILGLLGPNGAGKTTAIHCMLGLVKPSSGSIRILGFDINQHRRRILSQVNFSSAYTALPSNLTVRENLTVFARLYGLRSARKRLESLLELFEIEETADRITGSLSSGQLTRLNLCKAFLNEPEILFLDEPTASMDPDIAAKVRKRLHELQRQRGLTMIYTSHNMQEVEQMCDRVIFLAKGRIVMQGSPAEIIKQSKSRSLEDLFIAIARNGHLYRTVSSQEDEPCGSE
ncbi:MAG: ABC transporter ATP-binding protein [Deltaproteobacteria bacterium]|jgi:ABC-2 type transport system ATP-binding protein|nr:ABC transporter ATP-binding protein [Deltaproteobacteria bacterium]